MIKILYNIFLLLILFIGNILIKNNYFYFLLIYIFLTFYHIYIYCFIFHDNKINNFVKSYICIIILSYIISYFIICDSNPFFFVVIYYTFFPSFIKAVLIIIIHTYFTSTYINNLFNYNSEIVCTFKSRRKEYPFFKSYFLSDIFIYIKKKKKIRYFLLILAALIIFDVTLFFNKTYLWVYFNKIEKTLPIFSSRNTTFYITSNIFNMENTIEIYIEQMKKLINYLGENNVIISIVENGDSKDNTRGLLKEFKKFLQDRKILNKFLLNHEIEDKRKNNPYLKYTRLRIEYYANLRNKCLEFLYELSNIDFNNTIVLFFNDIVFYYEDIINLLSTNNENYDSVCGLDLNPYFYDRWVSIDLDGTGMSKYFPYFTNKEGQDLLINHKPIRIFSCWNGIIAFKADPLKNKAIQFRLRYNYTFPIAQTKNLVRTYYESECTYFNIDLHSLGFTKRFINPDVRVSYDYKYLFRAKYFIPSIEDIVNYFWFYFKCFTIRRTKIMSNYIEKNIKLNSDLHNWYLENRINNF